MHLNVKLEFQFENVENNFDYRNMINLCGGGVKYLHRDPASRKRRWNGAKKGRAIA
jgi:hypothetical protein